jgi:hypothetical protein
MEHGFSCTSTAICDPTVFVDFPLFLELSLPLSLLLSLSQNSTICLFPMTIGSPLKSNSAALVMAALKI